MHKFNKLYKFLFNKYSNSSYSVKNVNSFDQIKGKLKTINLAELAKMLKDH